MRDGVYRAAAPQFVPGERYTVRFIGQRVILRDTQYRVAGPNGQETILSRRTTTVTTTDGNTVEGKPVVHLEYKFTTTAGVEVIGTLTAIVYVVYATRTQQHQHWPHDHTYFQEIRADDTPYGPEVQCPNDDDKPYFGNLRPSEISVTAVNPTHVRIQIENVPNNPPFWYPVNMLVIEAHHVGSAGPSA
jgi:hypothetical protein